MNQTVLLAIKTAQTWGKPPSFMLGGTSEWKAEDRIAALGYQIYLGMICPECGNPLVVCRDPANDGWYEVESDTCFARRAIDEHRGQASYKPEPGGVLYPVLKDHGADDTAGYGARPW